VAHVLAVVRERAKPGTRLSELDEVARSVLAQERAGGDDRYVIDTDGWTIRSADGSRAAHVEHTIAVTPDGPQILTAA
jgi:methionyl aminopeptidase